MLKRFATLLRRRPALSSALLFVSIFIFLVLRNWPVFLLPDVYDGTLIKLQIVGEGFSRSGFSWYVHHFMLQPFNNAFQPVWFLLFYVLSWFDTNPLLWGIVAFAVAASILFLIGKIVLHFYAGKKAAWLYAGFCALVFSSSLFFLEVIAWKWMTLLLLSSAGFLCCFYMVLEHNGQGWIKKTLYAASLAICLWTFGTGWIMAWGLVLFTGLKRYGGRKQTVSSYFIVSLVLTLVGAAVALLANRGETTSHNLLFFVVHAPAMLVLVAANGLGQLVGVFRFVNVDTTFLDVSSVLGYALLLCIGYYFYGRLRARKLTDLDRAVLSLLVCYVLLVCVSLVRLMPPSGLDPVTSFENYIIGNRYLFAFGLPLFLAVALLSGKAFLRLRNQQMIVAVLAALVLGVVTQTIYARTDPFIANNDRRTFYRLAIPALKVASDRHLPLPDTTGDVLFRGAVLPLHESVGIRKDSVRYHVTFKAPASLSARECRDLQDNVTLRQWLDSYNPEWCIVHGN